MARNQQKRFFIFKDISNGQLYYIDMSSYSGALIRMDVMRHISQNAVEVTQSTSEFATGGPGNIEMSNYWYSMLQETIILVKMAPQKKT